MVFDTETQSWEPTLVTEGIPADPEDSGPFWCASVVLEDKIFLRGDLDVTSFVYGVEERKWEVMDEVLTSKIWDGACVVDDVLYQYDPSKGALMAFDPKQGCWTVVNGLEDFFAWEFDHQTNWYTTMNCGPNKLALFHPKLQNGERMLYCAEVALERRKGGKIRGKVQWCDIVIGDGDLNIVEVVAVTV